MSQDTADPNAKITVRQAAEELLDTMAQKDLEDLRTMTPEELPMLHFGLGGYVRNHFHLWSPDTRVRANGIMDDPDDVSYCIVQELRKLIEGMPTVVRQ